MITSQTHSVLVHLAPGRGALLAPVARRLLEGLVSGNDVRACDAGVVLAGSAESGRAREIVARAVEGFAAHLDEGALKPVVFGSLNEPAPLGLFHPLAMSGLVCEHRVLPPGHSERFLHRFLTTALRRASGCALRRELTLACFAAGAWRYVALIASFNDHAVLDRVGGERGFTAAVCQALAAEMAPHWPELRRALGRAGAVAAGGVAAVEARLPVLGPARDDLPAYQSHLERMLGRSVRYGFVAPAPGASDAIALPAPVALDLAPYAPVQSGVPDLHLRCSAERFYDATRGALLAQLVQSNLHHLVERGAADGSRFAVDAWPVRDTCGLERHVVPATDGETLWALTVYVDEVSAEHQPDLSAEQFVSRIRACIELVLAGVAGARWWSSKLARLTDLPEATVATDVRTARRYYFACAVLDGADIARLWLDADTLCRSIEERFRLEEAGYAFH